MESIRFSPSAQKVVDSATDLSVQEEHHYLGVEHLFSALIDERSSGLATALTKQNLDLERFQELTRETMAFVDAYNQDASQPLSPPIREHPST